MAWAKPPPELLAAFADALPADPRVERRRMFGLPCGFVNGNMFAGVHEGNVVLRLSEADRANAVAEIGAVPFMPMGRAMKEYVAVDGRRGLDRKVLQAWLARSLGYASGLPPKPRKAAKAKSVAPVKAKKPRA